MISPSWSVAPKLAWHTTVAMGVGRGVGSGVVATGTGTDLGCRNLGTDG